MGPPRVPPKTFLLKGVTAGIKKSRAFMASLRTNSKPLPWMPLVPDLITWLMMPPEVRPYSAS